MRVRIPTPLRAYTNQQKVVEGEGATVSEVLDDLDRRFPGIRFRMVDEQEAIRAHIKIFVNREQARTLNRALAPGDEVLIVAALSGG